MSGVDTIKRIDYQIYNLNPLINVGFECRMALIILVLHQLHTHRVYF